MEVSGDCPCLLASCIRLQMPARSISEMTRELFILLSNIRLAYHSQDPRTCQTCRTPSLFLN